MGEFVKVANTKDLNDGEGKVVEAKVTGCTQAALIADLV